MDKNHVTAILEMFETLARLMQSGDVSGDEAGAILELMLAGARAEVEASHSK